MTRTTTTGKQHSYSLNKRMCCVTTTVITITAAFAAATTQVTWHAEWS